MNEMENGKSIQGLMRQIWLFTIIRTVFHTSYRMVYPFLSIFARGMGVDISAISLAITGRSLIGVAGPFLAPLADTRGRKFCMLLGMIMFILSAGLVGLYPGYITFFIALSLTSLGAQIFLPAMMAFIGDRSHYQERGRLMGITELAWSLGFVVGVPIVGWLINRLGWQIVFPIMAVLALVGTIFIVFQLPNDQGNGGHADGFFGAFKDVATSSAALAALGFCLGITVANETVNLVFGLWIEDAFQFKIAALGAASVILGIAEFSGAGFSAWVVDRLGKERSIQAGLMINVIACLVMLVGRNSLWIAMTGLLLFYLSFEFALVSSLPLLSEILPKARATLMGLALAFFSLGRAIGALIGMPLYKLGFGANVIAAIGFNLLSLLVLVWVHPEVRTSHHMISKVNPRSER